MTTAELFGERLSWRGWPAVQADWQGLVEASPYASFFHSPVWIETWLEVYGSTLESQIALFRDAERPVAGALVSARAVRRGPVLVRTAYLNACGEDEHEETALEFNDLLCLPGYELAAARALRRVLDASEWDELVVPGCCRSAASDALKQAFADTAPDIRSVASFVRDLDALRTAGSAFEATLSHRRRQKIRRSLRSYQASGPIEVVRGRTAAQALAQLREMADLHQATWQARGERGAFASERFRRFHELLVERAFDAGHIQMAAVRCAGETIGVVYCLGWRGRLYFYQSGFHYSADRRLSPGMVTLLLCIQTFLEEGWREFDFMAGDNDYKRAFSSASQELEWLTFRRPTPRTRTVTALKKLRAWTRR
jgi:CelD/BcsL family acetyltransferase involved in cellulose biosynthesis